MTDVIKISFITAFVLSFLNFLFYFLLNKFWKKPLLEQVTYYWLSLILIFLIEIPLQGNPYVIALVFSLNLIPAIFITKIYIESFGESYKLNKYLMIQAIGLILSFILHRHEYSFSIYTIPIAFCVALPGLDSLLVLYKKRKIATPAHYTLAVSMGYAIISIINFCVNRMTSDPDTLLWGWVIAVFSFILNSTFIPFFILQEIFTKEENKLKDIIQHRTKDLTTLNSILSHDISNALQVIDMQVWRASKTQDLEMLPKIKSKLDESLDLLSFVKTYFKNKDRNTPIEQIYLEKHLLQVVDDYYDIADEKEVKIKVTSELPQGTSVLIDPNLFKTCILGNILKNAIKFSHPGENIYIRTIKDINGKIIVTIQDTGIGITQQQIDTLFTREGKSTLGTRGEIGTGLGLPIVKELMEDHGGQITVSSQVNMGTTVTLEF